MVTPQPGPDGISTLPSRTSNTGRYRSCDQVSFSMVKQERDDLRLAGAELRPEAASTEQAKFDLTLTLVEGPDRILALLARGAN